MSEEHEQWCLDCGKRFTAEDVVDAKACPACGSDGVPCTTVQDVIVEVNWHELRCLGIWADNWCGAQAQEARKTVQSILHRLERQYPTLTPLTMGGEIRQVREAIAKGDLQASGIEQVGGTPAVELPVIVNGPGAVGYSKETSD